MFKNRLSAPQSTTLSSPALHPAVFISSFLPPPFHAEIPLGQPSGALSLPSYFKALFELGNPSAWQLESQVSVQTSPSNSVLHGVRRNRGCAGACGAEGAGAWRKIPVEAFPGF